MRWLCHEKHWLIVFDSVSVGDIIDLRLYFPSCRHGKIIVTTIRSDLNSKLGFNQILLQGVDDLAGCQILLRYLGRVSPNNTQAGYASKSLSPQKA